MAYVFFGSTISETYNALFGPNTGKSVAAKESLTKSQAIVRIIITFVLLAMALYLIKTQNAPDSNYKELPSVIIGGIIGYWLK